MEAKELMVGNIIEYNGKPHVWREGHYCEEVLIRQIKPIPLTEEWLIKLGFVTDEDDEEAYHNTVLYLERNNNKSPFWGVWKGVESNIYLRHIDYVHELQNLFHSLTGEELTIKES